MSTTSDNVINCPSCEHMHNVSACHREGGICECCTAIEEAIDEALETMSSFGVVTGEQYEALVKASQP